MVLMSLFFLGKRKRSRKEKGRKGQTEMIGLVVIVIIIVIGALFYVRFGILGKPKEKTKEDTISAIQAYNLMNAIMNIKICEGISVMEGLGKCKNKENLCEKDACEYLDKEIDSIVKSVIYRDYSLSVNSSGWSYSLGKCKKYGVTSYPYIYNLQGESYSARFKLC